MGGWLGCKAFCTSLYSKIIYISFNHNQSIETNINKFDLMKGIVSSGITYYVQGMVMKTRGPVFVTAFNPLCMILVALIASFILHEQIHFGWYVT